MDAEYYMSCMRRVITRYPKASVNRLHIIYYQRIYVLS